MSGQRDANHELLFRFQLMTFLSAKFLFLREGVVTDEGMRLNSEMRLVRGSQRDGLCTVFLETEIVADIS